MNSPGVTPGYCRHAVALAKSQARGRRGNVYAMVPTGEPVPEPVAKTNLSALLPKNDLDKLTRSNELRKVQPTDHTTPTTKGKPMNTQTHVAGTNDDVAKLAKHMRDKGITVADLIKMAQEVDPVLLAKIEAPDFALRQGQGYEGNGKVNEVATLIKAARLAPPIRPFAAFEKQAPANPKPGDRKLTLEKIATDGEFAIVDPLSGKENQASTLIKALHAIGPKTTNLGAGS